MSTLVDTQLPLAALHASAPERLPFAPSLEIRAFLLERERGNVLMYSTAGLAADADALGARGDIVRQYLNHGHEAAFASDWRPAPLFVHRNELDAVAATMKVRGTFSRRHTYDDDLEVIPVPGHTSGATAYLWDSGDHRMLFTGDTIMLSDGEWRAAVLESSDRAAYLESLELIRELDFDVLVPWATGAADPPYAWTSRADATRRIDAMLKRVRRGESG
jgi:glyoxylase-like metal-dependent hydrolase (beta-lactamase superfamily II)